MVTPSPRWCSWWWMAPCRRVSWSVIVFRCRKWSTLTISLKMPRNTTRSRSSSKTTCSDVERRTARPVFDDDDLLFTFKVVVVVVLPKCCWPFTSSTHAREKKTQRNALIIYRAHYIFISCKYLRIPINPASCKFLASKLINCFIHHQFEYYLFQLYYLLFANIFPRLEISWFSFFPFFERRKLDSSS